jgi:hypothetical protein
MIYDKGFAKFPDNVRYGQSFEYMFVLSKGKPKTFNPIKTESTQAGNKKKLQIGKRMVIQKIKSHN